MTTIAITGINSYFAKTVLPKLMADPEIESIIGIDVTPWTGEGSKVAFFQEDVRKREIYTLLKDADIVLHLAFIVEEIRDKKKTHAINVEGSKNVFQACAANGVKKIVYTSSIAAYGAHPDNPIGITEEQPLIENPDSYYSTDKVVVEKFLDNFQKDNPKMIITRFRPPIIVGPNLNNFAVDFYTRKKNFTIKGKDNEVQFLHENDLGEALYLAIKKDFPGAFNIAADDYAGSRRLFEIAGVKTTDVPVGLMRILANVTFFLGMGKMSQGWVSLMEYPVVVDSSKFKAAAGWQPRYTTEEAFRDFLNSIK
jgi:UDP-glucose 4-epimerase